MLGHILTFPERHIFTPFFQILVFTEDGAFLRQPSVIPRLGVFTSFSNVVYLESQTQQRDIFFPFRKLVRSYFQSLMGRLVLPGFRATWQHIQCSYAGISWGISLSLEIILTDFFCFNLYFSCSFTVLLKEETDDEIFSWSNSLFVYSEIFT